ncbi:hypothetical protein [Leucobacter massiliensis]|uniref:Growth inhibitor PemK n=1 Tax=Leucobacter massiliensis TaxID=1686285 RepID=A0A2S9QRC0_9MICO|nr:hypothetical protein [Leucobacter massiliensis]PRI12135.1 hypothetical protein B4915_03515 [Leucobacter massiliensis]
MLSSLLRSLASALLTPARRSGTRGPRRYPVSDGPAPQQPSPGRSGPGATRDLSRAEIATLRPDYQPRPDGDPDPGEVVWTWVPYAENDGRGKDRPVLIIARLGEGAVAGCYLSTKPHSGFVSVGSGAWDGQGRESFLAPERVLRVTADGMRREGHVLSRDRFDRAVTAVRRAHGLRG